MFCPQCRDEFREGFTWCQGCAVALVENLPDAPTEIATEDAEAAEAAGVPVAAPARPEEEGLRVLELGLVLFIGFAYSMVASLHDLWRGTAHGSGRPGIDPLWAALSNIAQGVPEICVLIYVLARQGRTLRQIGVTARWSDLPLGIGLCFSAMAFKAGLAWIVISMASWPSARSLPWGAWRGGGVSTEVLAPLTLIGILCLAAKEELIVRAFMMTEVLALTDSAFLAVASSTCFQALYHLYQGRWHALGHAMTFLVFSLFYWKTRRATPVVLAHVATTVWLRLVPRG